MAQPEVGELHERDVRVAVLAVQAQDAERPPVRAENGHPVLWLGAHALRVERRLEEWIAEGLSQRRKFSSGGSGGSGDGLGSRHSGRGGGRLRRQRWLFARAYSDPPHGGSDDRHHGDDELLERNDGHDCRVNRTVKRREIVFKSSQGKQSCRYSQYVKSYGTHTREEQHQYPVYVKEFEDATCDNESAALPQCFRFVPDTQYRRGPTPGRGVIRAIAGSGEYR